nr:phytosulfokine receptor 1-like [Tanacetum cinerariifolium]
MKHTFFQSFEHRSSFRIFLPWRFGTTTPSSEIGLTKFAELVPSLACSSRRTWLAKWGLLVSAHGKYFRKRSCIGVPRMAPTLGRSGSLVWQGSAINRVLQTLIPFRGRSLDRGRLLTSVWLLSGRASAGLSLVLTHHVLVTSVCLIDPLIHCDNIVQAQRSAQNLTCDPYDLRGLTGLVNGLDSPVDGWWFTNASSNSCDWVGITCDASSGRIVRLDLPNKRLSGIFNASVSNLDQLKILNLSHNSLKGPLPTYRIITEGAIFQGIYVLTPTEFGFNYFTGVMPLQYKNCYFLEHLSVASNYISCVIPNFLFTLPRLWELALEDNEFTNFTKLSKFELFSAHSNNLSGVVPLSLSNSETISTLIFRNNSLDGFINLNCSMMVNLTSLDPGSNNFSGTLPANLASCQKLKALNLAKNKLTGQIPESFRNFASLSYVSISNCSFSNLSTSLKILQHCLNLTVLVLTMNYYAERLPSDGDLQFKALVIANCRLRGGIPSWLKGLTQPQLLYLSYNQLTGSIPSYFRDFKFLFYLDLSNNSLSGEIPKSLTHLQSLISRTIALEDPSPDFPFFKNKNISSRRLTLQYNQIMRLPPQLDLSRNYLTGPIWPDFGNLKKLHALDLRNNNLSGTIPGSLSGMTNIEALDLSYNSLTGIIPSSLVRLSFLSKFSVAYNNLTGTIPSGGQFWTFPISSFEGNPGLCGNFFVSCPKNQDLLPPPTASDKDEDVSILRMLLIIGFGTGFLLTGIPLLVVPGIMGAYKTDKFE